MPRQHNQGLIHVWNGPRRINQGGGVTPADLFADGQNGAWYDFAQTDRLFQLSTGQTAVTVAGNPIGQALEGHDPLWTGKTLAQLVATQPEILSNTDFATDTVWTKGTGWTIASGVATHAAPTSGSITQAITATAARIYRVGATVSNRTSSSIAPQFTGGASVGGGSLVANGAFVQYLLTTAAHTAIGFLAGGTFDGSIDDASLKLIPGNHATQATAGSRPTWQATGARGDGTAKNLLTTLSPAAGANCILASVSVPITLAATQVVCGTNGATDGRFWLGINTAGQVCAGVGTETETTIVGTTDLRGSTVVIGLSIDGTTVQLFAGNSVEYTGAQSGNPTTTVPFRLLALNNNGTAASFFAGDVAQVVIGREALTTAQFAGMSRSILPQPTVLEAWMATLAQQSGEIPDRIVDPTVGSDSNTGSVNEPWATLAPLRTAVEALPNGGSLTAFIRSATYTDQHLDMWNTAAPISVTLAFEDNASIVWTNPTAETRPGNVNGVQLGDNPSSTIDIYANGLTVDGFATGSGNAFGVYGVLMTIYGEANGINCVDGLTTHGGGRIVCNGGTMSGMNKAASDNVGDGYLHCYDMTLTGAVGASQGILRFSNTVTGYFEDCTIEAAFDLQPMTPKDCEFVRGQIGTAEKRVFITTAGQTGLVISPETVVHAVYE